MHNITYRKESKRLRSRHLLSPDKLAANRGFEALSGSRSGSDNIIYEKLHGSGRN